MIAEEFRSQILQVFFQDVHRVEKDNYSWERFSHDGVDRSGIFDVQRHVRYLEWFLGNYQKIFVAFSRLTDEASRNLFVDLIRYRLAGHVHVRINSRVPRLSEEAQQFREVFSGSPSIVGAGGMFGSLVHYDQHWRGVHYVVDTIKDSLIYPLVYRQYFYDRDGMKIQAEAGDRVIDGGAFTGDSACIFSRTVGADGRVYTFDPVANHLEMIYANVRRPGYENVTVFPYGLSDKTVEASPIQLGEYHPGWRVDGNVVPLCRIDDLVIDGRIDRVDFIKLDIEGSELAAIRGALATIHRFRPKLAISIYHKPDDYFEILDFLHDQQLGYRFYLDHYTIWDEETVLYARVA